MSTMTFISAIATAATLNYNRKPSKPHTLRSFPLIS